MTTKYYDIVIIGSGIAGLYSAYKIKETSPSTSFLVLEKYKKHWVGGRTSNDEFYGTQIVTGAGIGREDTNPLLVKLLKELHIPFQKTTSVMDYAKTIPQPINVVKVIDLLRKEYKKNRDEYKKNTFKQFAIKILGKKLYNEFIISVGYSDFEDADIYESLYNYGFDDTVGGWPMLFIPWKKLVSKLVSVIGTTNIKFSQDVIKIDRERENPCFFNIETEQGSSYLCNKVILATTINSIQKLLPQYSNIYTQIHGQPFLRLYGKFDKASTNILNQVILNYTIVPGPLQKIIPMNSEKGVYMISYSDNENAKELKPYLENNIKNREYLCRLIEKTLGLPMNSLYLIAIKDYYWPVGTHYYEPLKLKDFKTREDFVRRAQHPMANMLVVGEVVSRYQGWVEGALESVETGLTKKWIQHNTC